MSLSWDAITGATQYKLEWSGSSKTGSFNTSGTTRAVTNLVCNIEYSFSVSAKGDDTTYSTAFGSAASVSQTTSICPAAPAPSDFTATSSTRNTVTLSWMAVTDAKEYELARRVGSGNWAIIESALSAAITSYNATSLARCTNHQFRIRAKGDGSPYSTVLGAAARVSKATTGCVSPPPPTATPTPKPVTVRISGSRSVSRAENGASVATYSATVSNGRSAAWSLPNTTHETDRSKFSIASNGALSFRNAPDFENPSDSNSDNVYKVTVKATSGSASDSLNVTITVTNVNEGPTVSGHGSRSYEENATAAVAAYSAADPEGDPITAWSLPNTTHETDSSQFSISSGGVLSFRNAPDYEDPSDSNDDNIYKITVRATSSGGTGDMDVTVTVTNILEPPTGLAISVNPSDDSQLDVSYTLSESPHAYQFELQRSTSTGRSAMYSLVGTENDNLSPVSFDGLTGGYWYIARGRNCATHGRTGCGPWGAWTSTAFYLKPKLAKPTGLDIIPLPQRKARLKWPNVPNAVNYVVEVRKDEIGGQWTSHNGTITAAGTGNAATHSLEIDLAYVIPSQTGLTDPPYAYEFRVTATRSGTHFDSEPSESIRIADTPIKHVNGDSVGSQSGKAVITWTPPAGVTDATARYRRLLASDAAGLIPHMDYRWLPNEHSLPSAYSGEAEVSDVTKSEVGLDGFILEEVYAIQLNYKTGAGWTYAARDAYVWPAKRAAGGGERVAGFPLNYPVEDKTYAYRICKNTFPFDLTGIWERTVKHALGQWQFATDGLVTMEHSEDECADYTDFLPAVREVVAVEFGESLSSLPHDEWLRAARLIRTTLNTFDAYGITHMEDQNQNNVRMIDDVDPFINELVQSVLLWEVGGDIGYGRCDFRGADGCAVRGENGNSTDILLRRIGVDPTVARDPRTGVIIRTPENINRLRIPGVDDTVEKDDTRLGVCPQLDMFNWWWAYRVLVHESGHALGIRGGNDGADQARHHPQTPDSSISHGSSAEFCSPTPLDALAIYALYQTID